ncbi:hypothetical protein ACFL35_03990 [Candidatus Riflebacteria bacterium]
MKKSSFFIFFLLFCSPLFAARIPFIPPFKLKKVEILDTFRGDFCGIKEANWYLFKEAKPFKKFWKEFTSHLSRPASPPDMDFKKKIILVYCFGETFLNNHTLELKNIRVEAGVLRIPFQIKKASWSEADYYGYTNPWIIFLLEKLPHKGYVFEAKNPPLKLGQ